MRWFLKRGRQFPIQNPGYPSNHCSIELGVRDTSKPRRSNNGCLSACHCAACASGTRRSRITLLASATETHPRIPAIRPYSHAIDHTRAELRYERQHEQQTRNRKHEQTKVFGCTVLTQIRPVLIPHTVKFYPHAAAHTFLLVFFAYRG